MGQDLVGSAHPTRATQSQAGSLCHCRPYLWRARPALAASHFYQKIRGLDISLGDHSREQETNENFILKMIINSQLQKSGDGRVLNKSGAGPRVIPQGT
jgi:hypothetical protein